jgi:nitroreductase
MNAVIEAIKNRRSTRKYETRQLSAEHLEAIIEAGLWAPSGHNDQGWHLTVLRSKTLIDEFSADAKDCLAKQPVEWLAAVGKNKALHIFYNAPVVVVISGRKDAVSPFADCCAAAENMLLAAESVGAASCWIGLAGALFKDAKASPKWHKLLNIPEGYEPHYCVTLGYRDGAPGKAPARKEGTVTYID